MNTQYQATVEDIVIDKPVVYYDASKYHYINVHFYAHVYPINHPNPNGTVSNEKCVITSKVITHDEHTGEFETQNTIYKPRNKNNNVFRNPFQSSKA